MARQTKGWIKLHRSLDYSDIMDNATLLRLWAWLLINATWQESKIVRGGKQKGLPPGSIVFGLKELADRWGCSRETIRKWVKYLEKTERITVDASPQGYTVTIRNWTEYQAKDEEGLTDTGRTLDGDWTDTGQPVTLNKKVRIKELKKEEEKALRAQETAVAIPDTLPIPVKFTESTRHKMQLFIAAYASGWKKKYGGSPEGLRDKAIIGKIGHWIGSVSADRAQQMIQVYLQIEYRPFNESCHDLWQFFRNLNRIGIGLDTGKDGAQVDWGKIFV